MLRCRAALRPGECLPAVGIAHMEQRLEIAVAPASTASDVVEADESRSGVEGAVDDGERVRSEQPVRKPRSGLADERMPLVVTATGTRLTRPSFRRQAAHSRCCPIRGRSIRRQSQAVSIPCADRDRALAVQRSARRGHATGTKLVVVELSLPSSPLGPFAPHARTVPSDATGHGSGSRLAAIATTVLP